MDDGEDGSANRGGDCLCGRRRNKIWSEMMKVVAGRNNNSDRWSSKGVGVDEDDGKLLSKMVPDDVQF
ncbi:hypothetical protein HanIR_Chr16g0809471 [Helianthus annuus]|nr:hypothetical protein HanIR_Chr16g0809471 [Helianthus annuus]